MGNKASGVHDTSFHNIMKCNVDIHLFTPCRAVKWHDHVPKDVQEHDIGIGVPRETPMPLVFGWVVARQGPLGGSNAVVCVFSRVCMSIVKADRDVECHVATNTFQEVFDSMTKDQDSIGSIHDVFSSASLSSVFFQRMLSGFGSIRVCFQCGFGTPSEPRSVYFSFLLSLPDRDTLLS